MQPTVLLKRTGLLVLAIFVGISFGSGFFRFAFTSLQSLLTNMTPEERMHIRPLVFFGEMASFLAAGFIFGVTSALVAPRGGRILIWIAAVIGFLCLLPFTLLEGYFVPIVFPLLPLAGSVAYAALVYVGQLLVIRFRPGRA